jgi:hypothetical protein
LVVQLDLLSEENIGLSLVVAESTVVFVTCAVRTVFGADVALLISYLPVASTAALHALGFCRILEWVLFRACDTECSIIDVSIVDTSFALFIALGANLWISSI